MIKLTDKPIDPHKYTPLVGNDINGAIVTFLGTTRLYNNGRKVLHLEYSAYKDMARKKLRELCTDVEHRWSITDVTIIHRLGHVDIGEISLFVALSTPHRQEAFDACQYIVDKLKLTVPIWKREVFEDGYAWIGSEECDDSTETRYSL
mgnify:FL=1